MEHTEIIQKARRWEEIHRMPSPGTELAKEEIAIERELEQVGLSPFIDECNFLSLLVGERTW